MKRNNNLLDDYKDYNIDALMFNTTFRTHYKIYI